MDLEKFNAHAQSLKKKNQVFFNKLKKAQPKNLDKLFSEEHDRVFAKTNCLTCANCCKTTSPVFYQNDIKRASRALKLGIGDFIKKYLQMDEEGDFVFTQAPCPFLGSDNFCGIYDARPKACREYPHTNRKKMHQILDLTYRNTLVCPAVLEIAGQLKKLLK